MSTIDRRHLLQAGAALTAGSIFGIPLEVAAQAAKGGVLVIGSTQTPRHLNSAVQSGIATMMPAAQLFASPIRMDKNWKPQPYLAESWTLSPDNRSVSLVLRKDAVFHDGKPDHGGRRQVLHRDHPRQPPVQDHVRAGQRGHHQRRPTRP